jgi:hypothetical protein
VLHPRVGRCVHFRKIRGEVQSSFNVFGTVNEFARGALAATHGVVAGTHQRPCGKICQRGFTYADGTLKQVSPWHEPLSLENATKKLSNSFLTYDFIPMVWSLRDEVQNTYLLLPLDTQKYFKLQTRVPLAA